ncbi:PREDICTED: protein ecdysoneless homolog [Priapulus caudatus]|uniref:Protein ecdysoneless homolog n=1 Tax=Priapulus caudatus TaxID=37621 RepID=A0ABM1EC36_PRICU|nr:PREDICTED: protein ecdysoneless homolog [Priapulus caudatus]
MAVTFTRCLYAQLLKQKYEPERIIGWNLPPRNHPKFKAHDLGMKLACGFEILLSRIDSLRSSSSDSDSPDSMGQQSEVSDVRWNRYLRNLKEKGYFRGEIEGSKLHQQLLSTARKYYTTTISRSRSASTSPVEEVAIAFEHLDYDMDDFKRQEKHLKPADSDSWLDISAQDLEQMLNEYGNMAASNAPTNPNLDLNKVSETMNEFVSKVSGYEGVEVPAKGNKKASGKVNFDADAFTESMQRILDFSIPHDDTDGESSSGMSGYGSEDDLFHQHMQNLPDKNVADENLQEYIELMDRELARTHVGQSFERELARTNVGQCYERVETTVTEHFNTDPPLTSGSGPRIEEVSSGPRIEEVSSGPRIEEVSSGPRIEEVSSGPRIEEVSSGPRIEEVSTGDDDFGDYRPVDVDLNLVHNLLESYDAQRGAPGPASTIIGSMGLHLPPNEDDH